MFTQAARPTSLAFVVLAGLALLPLACSKNGSQMCPIKGEVFVYGQPAVGAAVTFHPLNTDKLDYMPTATVETDGSFRLTTVSAYDGAPPGDYAVTITWSDSHREDGETLYGPDKLRRRFADPASSGLKVTVQPGMNTPPRFNLN